MIHAYLDESGIHKGANICLVAGYFGGAGQWRKFERDWKKALALSEVPLDQFHALNFVKRRGPFFGWTDADHNTLFQRLVRAITAHKISPVTVGLVVDDFDSFSLVQRHFFTGAMLKPTGDLTSGCPSKPYFVPYQRIIKRIAGYAPVGGKADFYFGLDTPFAKYAEELYNRIIAGPMAAGNRSRLGTISFPLAKETPQLQAADLLAFLTKQRMEECHAKGDWYVLPNSWLASCNAKTQVPEDHTFIDKRFLRDALQLSYKDVGNWDGDMNVLRLSDLEFPPELLGDQGSEY
jgi:hypothetical protein